MADTKALFISYDGMTDPLGRSQVIPYLSGLSASGIGITILSFEKQERFVQNESVVRDILAKNNIKWIPLSYTKKPPVLSTLYDVWRMYRSAMQIYREEKFDIVHCRSYISALAGLRLKRELGVKFIFDMRGFWADERVDGNIWRLSNPLYKSIYSFFKNKEVEFLENADAVITLTHVAEEEIHSWKKVKNNPIPISIVPCCTDIAIFSPEKINNDLRIQIRNDLAINPDDFILLYLGSLGTWYMLDEMLDFFKVLLVRKSNAKLLFVTNDASEGILNLAKAKNIDTGSIIITSATYDKVATYISIATASIFFIKPVFSKKGSSPVKQGEIMSMGIPVVCNAHVGDTDMIVEKYKSGVLVSSFDTLAYDKAITELLNTHFDSAGIIRGAREYFSLEAGVRKYLEAYETIMSIS